MINTITVSAPAGNGSPVKLATLARQINKCHRQCSQAMNRGLEHAMEAGQLLIQAKSQCKHGEWGKWLADNFEGAERTAQAYMRVTRAVPRLPAPKAQRVADLTFRGALSAVASNSHKVAGATDSGQARVLLAWEKHKCKNAHQAVCRVERDLAVGNEPSPEELREMEELEVDESPAAESSTTSPESDPDVCPENTADDDPQDDELGQHDDEHHGGNGGDEQLDGKNNEHRPEPDWTGIFMEHCQAMLSGCARLWKKGHQLRDFECPVDESDNRPTLASARRLRVALKNLWAAREEASAAVKQSVADWKAEKESKQEDPTNA